MAEKRGIAADWSRLPLDLFEKIAGTLDEDIAYRVRLGAVCKSWRDALKSTPDLPGVRLPLLFTRDRDDKSSRLYRAISRQPSLFNIGLGLYECYDIITTSRRIVALSSRGWILTADSEKDEWVLLNPVTRAQILIPPPPRPGGNDVYRHELVVTPEPLAVVMIGFSHGPILCYRRRLNPKGGEKAEDAWTEIFCDSVKGPVRGAIGNVFTYHQGLYFILEGKTGVTSIVDPDTSLVVPAIPPMPWEDFLLDNMCRVSRRLRLVRSSSGEELFLVFSPSRAKCRSFEVLVLDRSDRLQAKWSKTSNIGEDVLFLDDVGALALPAPRDPNLCRRNHIVYLGSWSFQFPDAILLGLFDVGNASIPCVAGLDYKNVIDWRWFVPTMS